jgi:hypothetical protein
MVFPNGAVNMGVGVPPGSNIVLAMHYPEGSAGMLDSTRVNIEFYPIGTPNIKEVYAAPVILKYPFTIQANDTPTLTDQFHIPGIPGVTDITAIGVFPHMHLLGKSIESYIITPANDTIQTVRINQWDFEWQDFYRFKRPLRIPGGSTVHAVAKYDNTRNNPHNPHNPPHTVHAGLNTTDEMFIVYYQFLKEYQAGWEQIDLEMDTSSQQVYTLPVPGISRSGNNFTASDGFRYQWYLDGQQIPGATSQIFDAQVAGAYQVQVIDSHGCSKKSAVETVLNSSITDLSRFDNQYFRIHPNPMNNEFNLEVLIPVTDNLFLDLVDVRGRVVRKIKVEKADMKIGVENLPEGIYFAQLRADQVLAMKKIVKN